MTQASQRIRSILAIGLLFGVGIGIATAGAPVAMADPVQLPECDWERASTSSFETYFGAGAVDSSTNTLWVFGGVDDSGEVNDTISSIDYSTAADPSDGKGKNEGRGLHKRYGMAAAYVPNSDAAMKGSVFLVGGAEDIGDPVSGDDERGENDVWEYNLETGSGSHTDAAGTDLGERIFAAAAYDPTNNMIVITGGVRECSMVNDTEGCGNADNFGTLYMKFTDTGVTMESGPPGGPNRTYGHSMVYDSTGNRMISYGGTRSGSRGTSDIFELPLADLATASWSALGTSGSAPAVAFHTAAYDAGNNFMIVHGGGTAGYFGGSESTNRTTKALNLGDASGTPKWEDLKATTNPNERMGGVGGFINATVVGMVMATGRTKFNDRGDGTDQSSSRNSELLVCGDAPVEPPVTPVTPVTPVPPTATPDPGGTPATPTPVTPTVAPDPDAIACPNLETKVPPLVIAVALGSPELVSGWQALCNPALPPSIWNTKRHYLSLRNAGAKWNPLYNDVIYKCGCP